MSSVSELTPTLAWDGGRRFAFALPDAPAGTTVTVIAHAPDASRCIAVWEAEAGLAVVILPDAAAHLDVIVSSVAGDSAAIAVELDAELAPAIADLDLPGLSAVATDGEVKTLLRIGMDDAASAVASLNLEGTGGAGRRIKVGPSSIPPMTAW